MYNIFNKFREKGLLFYPYIAILFYYSMDFPQNNNTTQHNNTTTQ